jgi:opacity protein-like surface antigen
MKKLALLVFTIVLVSLPAAAADVQPPLIKDQLDKINYSYGYRLGRELVESGIKFNPELVWQALHDGLVKAEPTMNKAEMEYFLELLRGEQL